MGKWGIMRSAEEEKRINQPPPSPQSSPTTATNANETCKDSSNDLDLPAPQRLPNEIQLPFRTQMKPDFQSREREANFFEDLKEHNVGNGYCAAWYSRRFFNAVSITVDPSPHSGMGLDCYVQWSSPIRRYGDLQVSQQSGSR